MLDAQRMAIEALEKHGLARKGWSFAWMTERAWLTCGLCCYYEKEIRLAPQHVRREGRKEIRDTILHEIAHALARDGHGPRWRAQCVRIGARPDMFTDTSAGAVAAFVNRWFADYKRRAKAAAGQGDRK